MSRKTRKFLSFVGAAVLLSCTTLVQAQWATLDADNSSVTYVSTKLNDISEIHTFDSMSGSISDSGEVTITIDAASINSGIELRDDRQREFLFEVASYPEITITAEIDLDALSEGASQMQFPAVVGLKSAEVPVTIDAFVSVSDSSITVSSAKPVILFVSAVGLTEGVAKLAELAGGIAIGGSTGVNFSLSFDK